MKLHSLLLRLIGIFLFIYILRTIDLSLFPEFFKTIQIIDFTIILILFLPQILTKVIRWKNILSTLGISYSLKQAFHAYTVSIFAGTITLGRLGEFAKMFYLKEDGHPYTTSFISVIIDRLYDLTVLLILAGVATLIFLGAKYTLFIVFLIGLGILGIILILLKPKIVLQLLHKLLPKKYRRQLIKEFIKTIKLLTLKKQIVLFSLTILTWIIYFFQVYYLTQTIHIPITFFTLSAFLAISAIITMIPISISGVGTRDATLIFLFGLIGLTSSQAIMTAFSVLIIYLLISAIGFIFWMFKPINLNKLKKG